MDNTDELLFKFKEHLSILNRSPATIEAYTEHAGHFLESITGSDIRQITTRMTQDYIAGLYDYRTINGKPYKTATICLKVRSIKRFFEFLEKANIIFVDPAEFITEPRQEKGRIKTTLTSQEARKILDQPNLGTLAGIRDRAVLEVFYSTGIRLNELCTLTIYDADLAGGMLRINKGKGSKDRVVPLGKYAVKFLREYITRVRPKLTKKNRTCRHLFVNRYGYHTSDEVASLLIKNGADIRAVQKMMGHVDLKTTQTYIRSLGIGIKKKHQKSHPRERDKEDVKIAIPKLERKKGQYEKNSFKPFVEYAKTVIGYRDRTILEALYSSGIRKEEVNSLTLADVDYNDGFLRIIEGKGKKDRIVPIGRIACRYLENYIKSVRPELIKDPYNNHIDAEKQS